MGGDHAGLRHQVAQLGGHLVDALDAVVDEEHLPFPGQFTPDRGPHLSLVVGADEGEHRVAFLGRGGDHAHLPDAGDRDL